MDSGVWSGLCWVTWFGLGLSLIGEVWMRWSPYLYRHSATVVVVVVWYW